MYDIPFISMMALRSIGSCRQRRQTASLRWRIRRDGERRLNTDAQTDDRSTASVDKKSQIRKRWRVDNRIDIWLTQISWTVSLIYKWIILYFISLKILLSLKSSLKKKYIYLTWKYSKTKIGHNFLPGLARCNLNADLSLSVLTLMFWRWKKTISNLKLWTLMLS